MPPSTSVSSAGSESIVLESDAMRLTLSAATGAVLQIENRARQLQLVSLPVDEIPWRVELDDADGGARWLSELTRLDHVIDPSGRAIDLRWTTASGLAVTSRIEVSDGVAFNVSVDGASGVAIDKIEYPVITGIGDLHDSADSVLVHSQGTGFLFRRPLHLFESGPVRRQGLRYSPYPEGFNGSTMQLMAYYAEGIGGFQMRTADPTGAMTWLNFYKDDAGALAASFMHQSPDIRPGAVLDVPYPILIEPLVEGTWYEAADRYRAWAIEQPWTARGPLAERADRPTWLLDEVGFATFGINARHDRAAWLDRFHRITDAPVFHVLGVNWPKAEAGYGRGLPGGRDDWFPARFARSNLETMRENGDYWAPFEFDLLLAPDRSEGDLVRTNQLRLPEQKYSFDRYDFPFQCPATDYLPALHAWRDTVLVGTYGADALYYDISANNVLMTCRDPDHGHPVGGGSWMVDAFATMWSRTGEAASKAKGAHVPQGAEMISELFIPSLDFYQARAEASPLSAFEADFFRDWIRTGQVEKIPLFTYVYHEYGPVRMDGWGKLSRETGELFFWVASRVALWGGLFELNYEFSDLEALEGFDDDPAEHYADIVRRAYEVDPAKVEFVREIAGARTGFARAWLVYGTMVRPLEIEVPTIELDYHLYNVHPSRPHHDERGTMRVDGVTHAAWRAPDGRLGFLFVNLLPADETILSITIDPSRYGLPDGDRYRLARVTADSRDSLGRHTGQAVVELTLPPRRVVALELSASGADAE